MWRSTLLLCCSLLAACAAVPPAPPMAAEGFFHDADFAPPSQPIDAAEVFRVSGAMRRAIAELPPNPTYVSDPRQRLIHLLYRRQTLGIEYDDTITHTAAQTFQQNAGNCLSLVIMAASFAKEMGLPFHYRSVEVDEAWSRVGGIVFASGHVNLALEWPQQDHRAGFGGNEALIIDFLPPEEIRGERTHEIPESTVIAMFMNNRAAEVLARGETDSAYWWAREAIRQDRRFLIAYNTLGVLYLRRNQPGWALPLFQALLKREPANAKVMGNLVQALQALGRTAEAAQWQEKLARLEPFPPYHFFNAGIRAMQAGNWREARALFDQEVGRQPFNPEFRFWLAQAQCRLGNLREARRQMELATQNSTSPQDHALYAAKLDRLRALAQ
jgi:Tfp pilus assembly protein PilF